MRRTKRPRKGKSSHFPSWDIHLLCPLNPVHPGSQALRPRDLQKRCLLPRPSSDADWESRTSSLALSLQAQAELQALAFLGLQLAAHRCWPPRPPELCEPIPLSALSLSVSLSLSPSIVLVLFLWRTVKHREREPQKQTEGGGSGLAWLRDGIWLVTWDSFPPLEMQFLQDLGVFG